MSSRFFQKYPAQVTLSFEKPIHCGILNLNSPNEVSTAGLRLSPSGLHAIHLTQSHAPTGIYQVLPTDGAVPLIKRPGARCRWRRDIAHALTKQYSTAAQIKGRHASTVKVVVPYHFCIRVQDGGKVEVDQETGDEVEDCLAAVCWGKEIEDGGGVDELGEGADEDGSGGGGAAGVVLCPAADGYVFEGAAWGREGLRA